MDVKFPHSIDYHSSEINPGQAYKTIQPGEKHTFKFTATTPACSCTTARREPVLMHTGAGMVGMMVVKPAACRRPRSTG